MNHNSMLTHIWFKHLDESSDFSFDAGMKRDYRGYWDKEYIFLVYLDFYNNLHKTEKLIKNTS